MILVTFTREIGRTTRGMALGKYVCILIPVHIQQRRLVCWSVGERCETAEGRVLVIFESKIAMQIKSYMMGIGITTNTMVKER